MTDYDQINEAQDSREEMLRPRRKKSVIIFICVVAAVFAIGTVAAGYRAVMGPSQSSSQDSGVPHISGDHVGVLYIEGEISSYSETYDHQFNLAAVDEMMENDDNVALMLYVETPGGGVSESDELYLRIKEYKEKTGRPVYAYFGSQATSGGYYISACADRIAANRNCWTGSIGVTIGTLYDFSGFLEKHGVETETITSGRNKAMGDITAPLTKEQKDIFQGLVDDAYDQFVSIVAEGRNMPETEVRKIADGRIYTARQAADNGLVDTVVDTYEDAVADMQKDFSIYDCEFVEFRFVPDESLFGSLITSIDKLTEAVASGSEAGAVKALMEEENDLSLRYMCEDIR